jgi:hypothetical protein
VPGHFADSYQLAFRAVGGGLEAVGEVVEPRGELRAPAFTLSACPNLLLHLCFTPELRDPFLYAMKLTLKSAEAFHLCLL